jgi:iron(III) transport system permease protein
MSTRLPERAQASAPQAEPPSRAVRPTRHGSGRLVRWLVLIVLAYFFLVPIARLVWLSFAGKGGYGVDNYRVVLSDPQTWESVYNTMYVSVLSTVMAVVLGVYFAWLTAYTDVRFKRLLQPFIILPFILPPYIVTLAWAQAFSAGGLADRMLGVLPGDAHVNLYSLGGIAFVLGITHFPIVYLLTVTVMQRIPREIEQAARASGAGRWTTMRRVTIVSALPGIAGGALLAFLTALDNFGVPAFLGIPANIDVLSTQIYQEIVGFGPSAFYRAAALSVLLGSIAVLGTVGQWLLLRRSHQSETVQVDNTPRVALGRLRVPVQTLTWVFLLFILVVPVVSMVQTSLSKAIGVKVTWSTASLSQYRYLFERSDDMQTAMTTSVKLAVFAMLICLVIGTYVAYVRTRRPSWLSRLVDTSVALPYALPGIVMGLAIIFAWVQPIPGVYPGIYGTWLILLVAYVTRFTFYQVRSSAAAFSQLDPSIEEAARASGAGTLTTWRRILLPLLTTGLLGGAGLVLLTSLSELTVSSILYSASSKTIGVVIFGFEQAGYSNLSTAASTVVLLIYAVVGAAGYTLQRLLRRRIGAR